ncbi:HlyD family secretion protein [Aureimonas fodinaquatilis]|uniref:HlyD family secretion protein n=1 Tax=Aureimonas fodinaquatilis TaxID=2565783 RepID=UPI00165E5094|nr:HlyD family efflux transporter periplasmic adaptor subunit [Aureimonas fodinaquatilis]
MIRNRIRTTNGSSLAVEQAGRHERPLQRKRKLGRIVYLLLVIGFLAYLVVTLTGHLFILKASGIVTSDRFVVGAAYTARVLETDVAPGSPVREGDVIARLESTEVLTSLAQLAQNTALIEERRQAAINRQKVVESLIPIAERRFEAAQNGVTRLDRSTSGNAISQTYISSVLSEAFAAERDLMTLRTEAGSVLEQLAVINDHLAEVTTAMSNTKSAYADGVVRAPHDGTVSAHVASPGQVLTVGEPVLELLNGETFVLAYLSRGRVYDVVPGNHVIITDGVRTVDGVVDRVDVVADSLPPEFRTTFGIQERQQIMRVKPNEPLSFPYLSRVTVASPWSLTHLSARLFGLFDGRF